MSRTHANDRIQIGISSCLLGQKVRFDGNHKQDYFLTDTLGHYFEYVPVCPEVAVGLGVPRPPIQLVGTAAAARALGVKDKSIDVTEPLRRYGQRMGRELAYLSGYIFKNRSPSCGMERVKIYNDEGRLTNDKSAGLYAGAFMAQQPLLPVEEEGRLGDPELRDNFLERVFAYRRWQEMHAQRLSAGRLVEFHAAHKLSLMAHGNEQYRELGRLIAGVGTGSLRNHAEEYVRVFMLALSRRATRKRHTNVLQHVMGYLKTALDRADKRELLEAIDDYRNEKVPRIVPVTLLKHHFRRRPDEYIAKQVYLYPSVAEMQLRGYL